jgi:acetyl esterase
MPDGQTPLHLDPDIAAFRALQQAAKLPDLSQLPIAEARRLARELRLPWNRGGAEMAETTEPVIAGMGTRLYRPAGALDGPAIVYMHGGGWTILDLDTHDRLCRSLAAASGVTVLALDYPLSPEVRFPVALERIGALVEALGGDDAPSIDRGRLAFAGDSAGGNLAVVMALRLRDAGKPPPQALGLIYGAFDADFERPSWIAYGDGRLPLSKARMRWFWETYIPDPAERRGPLASPLHADLAGLPPAFLTIADHDVLYDENLLFAERYRAAGNETVSAVYPGTIHGFLEADGAVGAGIAGRAIADLAGFLRARLA